MILQKIARAKGTPITQWETKYSSFGVLSDICITLVVIIPSSSALANQVGGIFRLISVVPAS